jgi:hypothetical protein
LARTAGRIDEHEHCGVDALQQGRQGSRVPRHVDGFKRWIPCCCVSLPATLLIQARYRLRPAVSLDKPGEHNDGHQAEHHQGDEDPVGAFKSDYQGGQAQLRRDSASNSDQYSEGSKTGVADQGLRADRL